MFAVKNTRWRSTVLATLPMLAAVGLLGCATTGSGLSGSAERLERNAMELSAEARSEGGDYSRDAQEFAREASDFRRVIQDRDSDGDDVSDAFADLSARYHALRDEVDDESSREAEAEFKEVTEAYLDIEREMRTDSRYRVASDD